MKENLKEFIEEKKEEFYFGFSTRIIIYTLLFLLLFISGISLFINSLNFKEEKVINYTETSNLDYKVYLKENDFYETPYLDKNMLYIASLIDKLNIDFKYNFKSDEKVNLDFKYKILGELLIMDEKGEKTFFKKTYTLLDEKEEKIKKDNKFIINENLNIDYGYYNSLANNFKSSYGISTTSKLNVYLEIEKNDSEKEDKIINDISTMSMIIPLSEKAVDIKMDYNEINNKSKILHESNLIIDNIVLILISLILIFIAIYIFIKLIRLLNIVISNGDKFNKYIKRLLTEYDRMIVETTTFPETKDNTIIKITKFDELLDVRDSLKLPIMYYQVNKQKCHFYISHYKKIYLHTVKAVDLEENK